MSLKILPHLSMVHSSSISSSCNLEESSTHSVLVPEVVARHQRLNTPLHEAECHMLGPQSRRP
jgi:hypothetical protein